MHAHVPPPPATPPSGQARDLQARLYRDIGISAVAAALRFTKMPDAVVASASSEPAPQPARRDSSLAA